MRRTAPGSARSRSAGGRTVRESDARSPAGPRPREKLKKLQAEADAGLKTSASYTVAKAVDDWAAEALDGLADETVRSHVDLLRPVTMLIGNVPLRDLTAQDVRRTLSKLAQTRSTRTMASTHNVLVRAIRHAEANDHVGRNVAAFVKPPQGKTGRPSRAMNCNRNCNPGCGLFAPRATQWGTAVRFLRAAAGNPPKCEITRQNGSLGAPAVPAVDQGSGCGQQLGRALQATAARGQGRPGRCGDARDHRRLPFAGDGRSCQPVPGR